MQTNTKAAKGGGQCRFFDFFGLSRIVPRKVLRIASGFLRVLLCFASWETETTLNSQDSLPFVNLKSPGKSTEKNHKGNKHKQKEVEAAAEECRQMTRVERKQTHPPRKQNA